MASSITSIVKTAGMAWQYTWSGTAPFRIWRSGKDILGKTTTATSQIFTNADNSEPPIIEITDSTETTANVQNYLYPPYATLQWRSATGAAYYRVEQVTTNNNGTVSYSVKQTLAHRTVGYYTFATPDLDDETTAVWRVVAVDKIGNENPITFSMFCVRSPAAPSIALSYSAATGNLTVSAR